MAKNYPAASVVICVIVPLLAILLLSAGLAVSRRNGGDTEAG